MSKIYFPFICNTLFFSAYKFYSEKFHVNRTDTGYPVARIVFLIDGSGEFRFGTNHTICIKSGDLIYIPPAIPYTSYWHPGTADGHKLEFYVIEFDLEGFNPYVYTFEKFENKFTCPIFDEIYVMAKAEKKYAATGIFFQILQMLSECLTPVRNENFYKIQPAIDFIEANLSSDFNVADLAKQCSFSQQYFYTLFKSLTGYSPIEYKNMLRTKKALIYIKDGYTLEQICESLNFSSCSHLRSTIKKHTGQNPSRLKDVQI